LTDAADSKRTAELYSLLVETVTDYAIFILDPEGRVASWNPGAARLKGYSDREIIGRHFSVFYADEDVEAGKPAAELQTAIRDGRVEDEGWRLWKDGSRFWRTQCDPLMCLSWRSATTRSRTESSGKRRKRCSRVLR
jgi:PAS domain S-box-containing protein